MDERLRLIWRGPVGHSQDGSWGSDAKSRRRRSEDRAAVGLHPGGHAAHWSVDCGFADVRDHTSISDAHADFVRLTKASLQSGFWSASLLGLAIHSPFACHTGRLYWAGML